jgi:hypothetical protein
VAVTAAAPAGSSCCCCCGCGCWVCAVVMYTVVSGVSKPLQYKTATQKHTAAK